MRVGQRVDGGEGNATQRARSIETPCSNRDSVVTIFVEDARRYRKDARKSRIAAILSHEPPVDVDEGTIIRPPGIIHAQRSKRVRRQRNVQRDVRTIPCDARATSGCRQGRRLPRQARKLRVLPTGDLAAETTRVEWSANRIGIVLTVTENVPGDVAGAVGKRGTQHAARLSATTSGNGAGGASTGGKAITVLLKYANKEAGTQYGMKMSVQVIDADDEEILASEEVTLKVDLDEW